MGFHDDPGYDASSEAGSAIHGDVDGDVGYDADVDEPRPDARTGAGGSDNFDSVPTWAGPSATLQDETAAQKSLESTGVYPVAELTAAGSGGSGESHALIEALEGGIDRPGSATNARLAPLVSAVLKDSQDHQYSDLFERYGFVLGENADQFKSELTSDHMRSLLDEFRSAVPKVENRCRWPVAVSAMIATSQDLEMVRAAACCCRCCSCSCSCGGGGGGGGGGG
jgi:hypothetical protein